MTGSRPTPAEHRVQGSSGRTLRMLVWEAPAPRGVVQLSHGYSEHVARYQPVAEALVAAGWSVFGHDHLGHGESEGEPGVLERFEDLVDDLAEVRRAGVERTGARAPVPVVAHSMGALVAIRLVQTRPDLLERGAGALRIPAAVLSAPWLATRVAVPPLKRLLGKVLWRLAPDLTIGNTIDPTLLSRDPEVQRARMTDPLAHARVSAGFYERSSAAQRRARGAEWPVGLPTLVLLPLADLVADSDATRRWAEGAGDGVELVELPGVRHEPFNDVGRNEILVRLVEWLSPLQNTETGAGDSPREQENRSS